MVSGCLIIQVPFYNERIIEVNVKEECVKEKMVEMIKQVPVELVRQVSINVPKVYLLQSLTTDKRLQTPPPFLLLLILQLIRE